MGEMLQDGGNPWRGIALRDDRPNALVGAQPGRHLESLGRLRDGRKPDGRLLDRQCPDPADDPDVLVTSYVRKDGVLIALASWDKGPLRTRLKIDWRALGLDPGGRG